MCCSLYSFILLDSLFKKKLTNLLHIYIGSEYCTVVLLIMPILSTTCMYCSREIYSVCGFNRNTKKEILQGHTELSGGGFTPLHATASAAYVLHFIRNWRTGTEDLGKIIRICYAWSASNAGVSFPLFERPEIEIPHMRGTVIPAIRTYLTSIDAKIHLDNTMLRPPLRKHDICIMDEALKY